ncbi:MAG: hypothetical protein IPP71_00560 [Bacteroidetes bacterium]|nr:hypothetical protein [Bacteroidota bacterium]
MSIAIIKNPESLFKYFVLLLLLPVIGAFVSFIFNFNFDQSFDNQYLMGDWLINYSDGGFKRRGLSGSLVFLIQDLTASSLSLILFLMQLTFFVLFLIYYFKGIWNSKLNFLYISLLLTPITFMAYPSYAFGFVGRKEIILFFIFAYYIYYLKYSEKNLKKEYFIYFLLVFAMLMHELTFFYIPYFIFAGYIQSGKFELKKVLLFFGSVLIPMIVLVLFGGKVNQGESYAIIAKRGITIDPYGVLEIADSFSPLKHYMEFWPGYLLYAIVIVAGTLQFTYFLKSNNPDKRNRVLQFFIISIIFSLPLFVIAIDWGRWIHIHFMLLLLLFSLFLEPLNKSKTYTKDFKIFTRNNLIALLIVFSSVFWKMDHFKIGINPGGIAKRIITGSF